MNKLKPYITCIPAFLLLATIYACNPVDRERYVGTALDPRTDPEKVDTTKFNSEYLLYSTVRINGKLPLSSKFAEFKKVIGEPDSLVNFNSDTECQFYDEPYQYIYLQGSMFFLVKDTAIFQNIDFRKRPDLEVVSPAITLNAKTTLEDVRKLFPKAVSKVRVANPENPGTERLVDLGASEILADEWWILLFEGDKLIQVEMYSPC
jgi:hypothetical protein